MSECNRDFREGLPGFGKGQVSVRKSFESLRTNGGRGWGLAAVDGAIISRARAMGARAFFVETQGDEDRVSNIFREFVEAILLALIVFVAIQTSMQNFKVEGSSMHPTLEGGQYLLVNKLVYFRVDPERWSRMVPFWKVEEAERAFAAHGPERGEVVVFHFPEDHSRDFVKRVIGLPGDRVEIREGTVVVNGRELDEPYITAHDTSGMGPLALREGEYFVLGDNRQGSNDSRNWGPVPQEDILGKVWMVYWPPSNWGILN